MSAGGRCDALPTLGLGVGLRPEQLPPLFDPTHPEGASVDFVELYTGDFADAADAADALPPGVAALLHGHGLSPVGADPVPTRMLAHARALADATDAPWLVEDLAVWRLDGDAPLYNPFWPPVLDETALALVGARLPALARALGRPFVCEFPPMDVPPGPMRAEAFFTRLARDFDAPIALDVSHWLTYAQRVGEDPVALLDRFPMGHVVEVHIAGGTTRPGERWYDEEHSAAILPACLALLDVVVARAPRCRAVTIEHHQAPPPVVRDGVARVAALPSVAALRREARAPRRPPDAPDPDARRAGRPLRTAGASVLARRQRAVRDLLQAPDFAAALRRARRRDRDLVPTAGWWREAGAAFLRRCPVPRPAAPVLERAFGAVADGVRAALAVDPAAARQGGVPLLLALGRHPRAAAWARAACLYLADLVLVARGGAPRSAHRTLPGGGYQVRYVGAPVAALHAVARGAPIPRARASEVTLRRDGGRVTVAAGPPAPRRSARGART